MLWGQACWYLWRKEKCVYALVSTARDTSKILSWVFFLELWNSPFPTQKYFNSTFVWPRHEVLCQEIFGLLSRPQAPRDRLVTEMALRESFTSFQMHLRQNQWNIENGLRVCKAAGKTRKLQLNANDMPFPKWRKGALERIATQTLVAFHSVC